MKSAKLLAVLICPIRDENLGFARRDAGKVTSGADISSAVHADDPTPVRGRIDDKGCAAGISVTQRCRAFSDNIVIAAGNAGDKFCTKVKLITT